MAEVKVTPHYKTLDKVAVSAEMSAIVVTVANEGKGIAEALAQQHRDSGEYGRSFVVEAQERTSERSARKDLPRTRVFAVLTNTAEYAAAVEWGNAATKGEGYRIMNRTAEALESEV